MQGCKFLEVLRVSWMCFFGDFLLFYHGIITIKLKLPLNHLLGEYFFVFFFFFRFFPSALSKSKGPEEM